MERSGSIVSTTDVLIYIPQVLMKNDDKENPDPSLQKHESQDGQMPSDVLST